jgi:hypothetical protein
MRQQVTEHEGKKYLRVIRGRLHEEDNALWVDVYDVCRAFGVTSIPIAHAIKKLLCPGQRGKGTALDDLKGAIAAINRAIDHLEDEEKCENVQDRSGTAVNEGAFQIPPSGE